ncbi:MAG: hypothetical protein NTX61_03115 [Bacteroidetes bacterium]|nr:hypothetical protein [Bacteroidota bacterium]
MKHKMISVTLIVSIFLVMFTVNAKSQFVAGGNLALGIPVGDFRTINTFGTGLDLYAGYSFYKEKMQAGIDAGYLYFSGQDIIREAVKYKLSNHVVPVSLFYSYGMPLGRFKPYIRLDLGLYFSTFHSKDAAYKTMAKFGLAPALGSEYTINDQVSVFLAAKMNIAGQWSYFGINIGAAYKLNLFK